MRFMLAILTLSFCAVIAAPAQAAGSTKEELQADARKSANETLKVLYTDRKSVV